MDADIRELEAQEQDLKRRISELPRGTISRKNINGKVRCYHQWYSEGRTVSKYLRDSEVGELEAAIAERKKCQSELRKVHDGIERIRDSEGGRKYHNTVLLGSDLYEWAHKAEGLRKRGCYRILDRYLRAGDDRVCILYGLRRTGKTTLIRQAILDMDERGLNSSAYILVSDRYEMSELKRDMDLLFKEGVTTFFIDEVTQLDDFINGAMILSDIFVPRGARIVLSGTDSLGFWFAEGDALMGRTVMIHTTHIPFGEYSRLMGSDDVDDYIKYGGTLSTGQYFLETDEFDTGASEFADADSVLRYINRSIAVNIQNSLKYNRSGRRFFPFYELYEHGELTNVINRVVEDIDHRFVLAVVEEEYSSRNLMDVRDNLRHSGEDLLSESDAHELRAALMARLDILDPVDMSGKVTEGILDVLRKYLERLDVVASYKVRGVVERTGTLVVQPGIRAAQAEALLESIGEDAAFREAVGSRREAVLSKAMVTVYGRILEEVVIHDTMTSLDRRYEVFKLILIDHDVDMVVHDKISGICLLFEIKHSAAMSPNQARHLVSDEVEEHIVRMYGGVAGRIVLYRGEDADSSKGVRHLNVAEFLKGLPETVTGLFQDDF